MCLDRNVKVGENGRGTAGAPGRVERGAPPERGVACVENVPGKIRKPFLVIRW